MRLFWVIFKHYDDWRMVVWISNVNFHILGDFQTLCKTKEMNLIVYMSLLTTLIGEEIIGRENFSPGTPPFVKQWNRKENENTAINELETFCLGVLYLHSVWKSSKKGAFNIASEASCTYILSVQRSWKIPKIFYFSEFLKTRYYGQTVLPDKSTLKRQRLVESAKIEKGQMRHFE